MLRLGLTAAESVVHLGDLFAIVQHPIGRIVTTPERVHVILLALERRCAQHASRTQRLRVTILSRAAGFFCSLVCKDAAAAAVARAGSCVLSCAMAEPASRTPAAAMRIIITCSGRQQSTRLAVPRAQRQQQRAAARGSAATPPAATLQDSFHQGQCGLFIGAT